MYEDEIKQERSIGVSARVDLTTLAEVARYWVGEGARIKSVSQVINWSMQLLSDILEQNGAIKKDLDFVSARQFMIDYGLTQASNDKRGYKKIASATRFEMMRKEGYEPKQVDPLAYAILHNQHSVVPAPSSDLDMDAYNRARLEKQRERYEEGQREKLARTKAYKEQGFISESTIEQVVENDKKLMNTLDGMSLEDMKKGSIE